MHRMYALVAWMLGFSFIILGYLWLRYEYDRMDLYENIAVSICWVGIWICVGVTILWSQRTPLPYVYAFVVWMFGFPIVMLLFHWLRYEFEKLNVYEYRTVLVVQVSIWIGMGILILWLSKHMKDNEYNYRKK